MDDAKLMNELDFASFEETFKLAPSRPIASRARGERGDDHDSPEPKKPSKQLESLLEHTRLKNIAICKRKLPDIPVDVLVRAINALDTSTLSVETVELLQRMIPQVTVAEIYLPFPHALNP